LFPRRQLEMRMRRVSQVFTVLAATAFAILSDVIINLIANSIELPKEYYIAPVGFVFLVAVTTVVRSPRDRETTGDRSARRAVGRDSSRYILRGNRDRFPYASFFLGIASMFVFFIFAGLAIDFAANEHHAQRSPLLASIFSILAIASAALYLWMIMGVRVLLIFTEDGITLRNIKGRHFIGWDDATNFRTERPVFSAFLVATPVKGSTYFLGPWDYDKENNIIKICNLSLVGIALGAVDGALARCDPEQRGY
jgi:hypothetical protein